jgi:hypothetical protein
MTHLTQKKDTGLDLTISRAFAEAHVRFEGDDHQQHMVTFDIESAHRLGQMFDDRSMGKATAGQSKKASFAEACLNTIISYIIAVGIGHLVYGYYQLPIDLELNMKLTAIFTVASIVRGYVIRRWFNRRQKS